MDAVTKFDSFVERMPILLNELKGTRPLSRGEIPNSPEKGIYVFYEKDKPRYVGRSNSLKSRILRHGRESSKHYSACFAFKLMQEDPKYKKIEGTRSVIVEKNKGPFINAKRRIANMSVKTVEVKDPVEQALFEIYASLALNTKYNDFGTH
jgi:hypothetical protein